MKWYFITQYKSEDGHIEDSCSWELDKAPILLKRTWWSKLLAKWFGIIP